MRSSRLGRLVTDLFGRSGLGLLAILDSQIESAVEGATLARSMVAGDESAATARDRIAIIEHRGDEERRLLVAALSSTLTTPIDREDLFRLSRCVDDVLDSIRDFVRESHLYGLGRQPSIAPVLDSLVEGLQELQTSSHGLVNDGQDAATSMLAAKRAVTQVRRRYQLELADLFNDPLDMDTLKRRELLRRLDVAGLRLGEAADVLADGMMKRGH